MFHNVHNVHNVNVLADLVYLFIIFLEVVAQDSMDQVKILKQFIIYIYIYPFSGLGAGDREVPGGCG